MYYQSYLLNRIYIIVARVRLEHIKSWGFEKIEVEINKMVFDKKGLEEIVELFEDKYKISIEDIKSKYLKSEN